MLTLLFFIAQLINSFENKLESALTQALLLFLHTFRSIVVDPERKFFYDTVPTFEQAKTAHVQIFLNCSMGFFNVINSAALRNKSDMHVRAQLGSPLASMITGRSNERPIVKWVIPGKENMLGGRSQTYST